jgi:hypothetical protein
MAAPKFSPLGQGADFTIISRNGIQIFNGGAGTHVSGLIGSSEEGAAFNLDPVNYDSSYNGVNNPVPYADVSAAYFDVLTFFNSKDVYTPGLYPSPFSGIIVPGTYRAVGGEIQTNAMTLTGPGEYYFIASGDINIFGDITLAGGATPDNVYFISGGTISFANAFYITANGNYIAAGTVAVQEGDNIIGGLFALGLLSSTGLVTFNTNTIINPPPPPVIVCYAKGTKILTNHGYVAIENLDKNDVVATRGTIHKEDTIYGPSEWKRIVWLGHYTIKTAKDAKPVCFKAGALGDSIPTEDLYVSPSHGIVVDGRLVLAKELLNGETIVQDYAEPTVTYYHLELDKHSAIVANGVIAESYLDFGDRRLFQTKWFRPV